MKKLYQFSDWILLHLHTIELVIGSEAWFVVGHLVSEQEWLSAALMAFAGVEWCRICRNEYLQAVNDRDFYKRWVYTVTESRITQILSTTGKGENR